MRVLPGVTLPPATNFLATTRGDSIRTNARVIVLNSVTRPSAVAVFRDLGGRSLGPSVFRNDLFGRAVGGRPGRGFSSASQQVQQMRERGPYLAEAVVVENL